MLFQWVTLTLYFLRYFLQFHDYLSVLIIAYTIYKLLAPNEEYDEFEEDFDDGYNDFDEDIDEDEEFIEPVSIIEVNQVNASATEDDEDEMDDDEE